MEELTQPHPSDPAPPEPAAPTSAPRRADPVRRLLRAQSPLSRAIHRTVLSVLAHDCLNVAQSTAYSAIVALFPALIVAAAVIGLLPDTAPIRFQLAAFFDRVLPPGVTPLLDAAFENSPQHAHSLRALIGAGIVSFLGASNVIATLMEGFRRARNLPIHTWSFWERRRRAFELVPLSLVPLAAASLLVVFGHSVTAWLAATTAPEVRGSIYTIALIIRWGVSLGGSVGLIGLIYHLGVPDGHLTLPGAHLAVPGLRAADPPGLRIIRAVPPAAPQSPATPDSLSTPNSPAAPPIPRSWWTILPGAIVATAMWFLTTLAFGWYLTRFANYSEVYGSLGAGIALLFWLYIISLSVLCGAEFNAQLDNMKSSS